MDHGLIEHLAGQISEQEQLYQELLRRYEIKSLEAKAYRLMVIKPCYIRLDRREVELSGCPTGVLNRK